VLERSHFLCDLGRAGEDVAVFQQVGLEGEDLLHAERPLLVPRPRQPSASFQAGSCTARARVSLASVTASISMRMR